MNCPKCGFEQVLDGVECQKCGAIFSKYIKKRTSQTNSVIWNTSVDEEKIVQSSLVYLPSTIRHLLQCVTFQKEQILIY